ncbi:cell wall protein DAN4 [Poecilia reticulata]|uniref:cell wall protein DAN4 n=1 Tax=Poecilia reticulata TaxID=8081 RepID=UPI0004A4AB3F|nr:PREDICTED: cell wall protein DAN4-like [Poecilia reticulata]
MNGPLCCAGILAVLLFIPWSLCESTAETANNLVASTTANGISENETISESTNSMTSAEATTTIISTTTLSTPTTTTPTTTTTTTTTTAKTWTFFDLIEKKHAKKITIICAVLVLVCAILLFSTLALACKVCQLRRRLKTTGGNSEYRMGTDKAESQPEAKENCFLLTENGQTTQESENGATKEDGGKVDEVKQQGDEKEVGETQKSEEAATAAAAEESSPPSKPAEETASSEPTKDPPPPSSSSSDNTEEPKKDP